MSDCAKVRDIIYKYLKDELDKKKRIYVENHTKNCIMCSTEMEFARKKMSVNELLFSLQPTPSFYRRLRGSPRRINRKTRKIFSRHPVALPIILVLLFILPLFGFYIKWRDLQGQTKDKTGLAQTATEGLQSEALKDKPVPSTNAAQIKPEKEGKKTTAAALPKIEKKDEKIEVKKKEDKKEIKKEAKQEETVKAMPKTEEKAGVKMPEEKAEPASYRLTLKTELQPDIVFAKIESISEKLSAIILFAKGFSAVDSDIKKEILVKIPKDGYKNFLFEMKGYFSDVSSQTDKNIRLPNDITKDETVSFVLIEIN
ncbi:MAG: hypothetical protein HZA06_05920 [Nitrospirae bacterium]|nr:hypothetical protein [Nitrospirota bacterium]